MRGPISALRGSFRDMRWRRDHLPDSRSEEKKINLNLVGKEKLKSTSYLNTSSHTHTHKLKEVPWIVALCKIAKKL